jgi:Mg-chelatase subunit ChlD
MQLLSPLALLYLPAIAAALLLARRRVVRVRRPVGALFLWRGLDPRDPLAAPRIRLRRTWLLVVQAALLTALTIALAAPTLTMTSPRAVFLVDVSASMGAREPTGTRLELARHAALAVEASLPAGTLVDLWTTELAATVSADLDARRLPGALSRLSLSDGAADMAASLATIRGVSGQVPVFVFTDTPAPTGLEPQVRWTTIGSTQPNAAIVSLAARQTSSTDAATEIVVGVRNFGTATIDAPFELTRDAVPLATDRVRVPGHGMMTATLRVPALSGVLRARLLGDDALAADNVRFAILPEPIARHVLLTTSGNFFLERALASVPGVDVEVVPAGAKPSRSSYDVVVCDGCNSVAGTAPAILLPPAPATVSPAEPLRVVAANHLIARSVETQGLTATPVPALPLAAGADVIARAGDAPVIVASDVAGRRVVDLRMDLRDSPLVLHTAFPILISNVIEWVTGEGESPSAITAGEPFPAKGARRAIADTRHAGVYEAPLDAADGTASPQASRRFVVNPATETESDLTVTPRSASAEPPPGFVTASRVTNLRTSLLMAALLLLAVEVVLGRPLSAGARAFRGAVAVAIAVATIAPRVPIGSATQDVMFLVDRSASMSGDAEARALSSVNRLSQGMSANDRMGVIVFGGEAAIERAPESNPLVATITSQPSIASTDIGAALRLAREQFTAGQLDRAVLLSDGQQTAGDAVAEAGRAAADGLAVDVVPISADPAALGTMITSLGAPPLVRAGEPFIVSGEVRGRPGTQVEVEFRGDGELISTRSLDLRNDGTAGIDTTDVRSATGLYTYTASARLAGTPDGPAEAGAVVTVGGQPSLLYVSDGARTLEPIFSASQWRIRTSTPTGLPGIAAALNAYDAVVMENVDATQLSSSQTTALADFVQNAGGGLLVLGGTAALGGFRASPLARLLPVDVRPRSGTRGPGMALVLAFDKSGSMADVVGGVSKIEVARQSVLEALQVIPSTDLFGVVAFDARPTVIAPLAAGNDVAVIAQRLRALDADGPTAIAPAIDLAESWLRASGVSRRKVLLVSDGRTATTDLERLRTAVRARQFELSVVAIGEDADRQLLASLATQSGGRAYFPADLTELPKIVARDASGGSTGTTVSETFSGRVMPHPVTRGIDPAAPPRMTGYAVSTLKSGAELMLASHLDDPVLAGWRIGLGRVSVFTSDVLFRNSRTFAAWPAFGQLWSQTIRWVARQPESAGSQVALESTGQGLHIRLTFEPASGPERIVDATASLRSASGRVVSVPLAFTSPGRLEGTGRLSEQGPYTASLSIQHADGRDEHVVRGAYWSAIAERPGAANVDLLREIARTTGGRVLTDGQSPFDGVRPGEPTDVAPLLINVALIALLIDICRRRGLIIFPLKQRTRDAAQQAVA